MIQRLKLNRGISLVEVVISTAILLVTVTGLITSYNFFVQAGIRTLSSIQSSYLLEEGVEAVTTVRDNGWTTNIAGLSVGTKYYLAFANGKWTLSTTATKIDNFYDRYLTFSSVSRDSNDVISETGTIDSGTKKVSVYVSWPTNATTTTHSVSIYLTNLFGN